ncbi:MAG: hypothetical protein ACK4F7_00895 [Inhella sp.]
MKKRILTLSLLAIALGSQAQPCAEIAEPTARLACYDKQFPPKALPVGSSAPAAALVPDANNQRFGLPPERSAEPTSMSAQLSAVQQRQDGARIFVLDNGQRWLETDAQRRGVTNVGDHIEIRSAALGSFILVTPARVGIRVRRLP